MDYSFQITFTDIDRMIFNSYCMVAESVAKFVGRHCEVVVHSLEELDHSAVKVINGNISGRCTGAPLTNLCFDMIKDSQHTNADIIGPYYSLSIGGKTIRSITTIIRGENNRIIGLLCFNMDLSCPFDSLMQEYLAYSDANPAAVSEIYPHSVEELIHHMLNEAVASANELKGVSPLDKNLTAIQTMMEKGLFSFKGAVDIVAHELGISRTTVYNYLRDPRINQD